MKRATDPLRLLRHRTAATQILSLPVLALSAAWAFWPVRTVTLHPPLISPPPPDIRDHSAPEPLDLAAFDACLWTIPPPPVVSAHEPPQPPESPPKLKLIGIIHEHQDGADVAIAALYDADSDRLFFAKSGEKVGPHTVGAISDSAVELTSGRSHHALQLEERPKPSKRGGGT